MSDALYPMKDAPTDGKSVLLLTGCHGWVEAWFSPGSWSDDTPIAPAEYEGAAWVCADDAFQIEVEEGVLPDGGDHHGTALGWLPIPASSPSVAKTAGEWLAVCQPEDVAEVIRWALANKEVRQAFGAHIVEAGGLHPWQDVEFYIEAIAKESRDEG